MEHSLTVFNPPYCIACMETSSELPNFLVMQGDGEVSFCGAIEMSGWLDLKYGIPILSQSFAYP